MGKKAEEWEQLPFSCQLPIDFAWGNLTRTIGNHDQMTTADWSDATAATTLQIKLV